MVEETSMSRFSETAEGEQQGGGVDTTKFMESVVRVSVAGFGGALVGLSLSRRRFSSGRSKAYVDRELPLAWAATCGAFASVVEVSAQWVHPTNAFLNLILPKNDPSKEETNSDEIQTGDTVAWMTNVGLDRTAMELVVDYTLGGGIAGATFQGATIQTKAGERLASVAMAGMPSPSRSIAGGILPGMALGLFAGLAYTSLHMLEQYVDNNFDDYDDIPEKREEKHEEKLSDEDAKILAEVKNLSNDELQQQIDELRGTRPR
jgi:hypothetical protein|uniref:Uncharacterized protein n=1 Tax=Attheya septentrionalis TaxID=420275 RepID=A0A7S2U8B6_9STRA|mmetsp:Transcript_12298/g.22309  ORF Transcript_12298/g.22309 Transcript_12298/m.22309 type:complete len:262 (+) Transcript_12298:19-804(+)